MGGANGAAGLDASETFRESSYMNVINGAVDGEQSAYLMPNAATFVGTLGPNGTVINGGGQMAGADTPNNEDGGQHEDGEDDSAGSEGGEDEDESGQLDFNDGNVNAQYQHEYIAQNGVEGVNAAGFATTGQKNVENNSDAHKT